MASWVITDADRGPDGKILIGTPPQPAPDAPPFVPPPEPQPATPLKQPRPAADQHIAAFLPSAPAAPAAPSAPAPSRRVQLAGGALLIIVAVLAWFAWQRPSDAPLTTLPPTIPATAAPAVAASAPSAAPTAAPGCTITRAAATFYAPAGDPTGDALDPGTACHLVAWHSGFADWRQITSGGAPIWVRASVVSVADTTDLPDLAPPPTPTPAPATARPQIIVVTPTPCQVPAYTARLENVVDGLSIGYSVGESCVSQAEADANAQALNEQAAASYRATHPRR